VDQGTLRRWVAVRVYRALPAGILNCGWLKIGPVPTTVAPRRSVMVPLMPPAM